MAQGKGKLIMPRYREPGSIRPISPKPVPKTLSHAEKQMPLDYLLSVVWDETATRVQRYRAATACLPYCHAKLAERGKGVKDQQAEAAEAAGTGTAWAADLESGIRVN